MPRADGMPTNRELQTDFTTLSREVHTTAYDRAFAGSRIPPILVDKPLSALRLRVVAHHEIDDPRVAADDTPETESLATGLITVEEADIRREALPFRDAPEYVHDFYEQMAARLGSIAMTKELDVKQEVPIQGVIGSYQSDSIAGKTRFVDTLTEKPRKETLVMAKTFAELTLDYVNSDAYEVSQGKRSGRLPVEEYLRQLLFGDDAYSDMRHRFELPMVPDLPLSGLEPRSWLTEYVVVMQNLEIKMMERMANLADIPGPGTKVISDDYKRRLEAVVQAKARAMDILEKK